LGRITESELIKLAHSEGGALWLSVPERRLLKFALDTFGAPICHVLLSGLGEEDEANRWLFVITFADSGGAVLRRRLYVEAPDPTSDLKTHLPRRREPLVLLALLRLFLSKRRTTSSNLSYSDEEVLELLGWQDTRESRLVLDDAVGRYFFLNYRYALSKTELTVKNLSFYRSNERLISESGSDDVEEGGQRREAAYVEFSTEFIKGLLAHSLFGVEWDRARWVSRRVII
jgi:hypothetical protein